MDAITEIEEAYWAHWSLFGRWTRGELHDENGVLWFETPIKHLPYNAVIRTHVERAAGEVVAAVVQRFRARGVEFFWLVHPSARPDDLDELLAANGLQAVESATGMSFELADWTEPALPSDVVYHEVLDDSDLDAYLALNVAYWEIPDDEAPLVAQYQREWGPGRAPGHRYLALVDDAPVGKGYLSLAGPPGVAAIYGMSTLPQARGLGVASGLTTVLFDRARRLGCRRALLHSSDMAVGVYRRAGFVEQCGMQVFATSRIWSDTH